MKEGNVAGDLGSHQSLGDLEERTLPDLICSSAQMDLLIQLSWYSQTSLDSAWLMRMNPKTLALEDREWSTILEEAGLSIPEALN